MSARVREHESVVVHRQAPLRALYAEGPQEARTLKSARISPARVAVHSDANHEFARYR